MYPVELDIKDTTEGNTSAYNLDLFLSIGSDSQLHTSIFDTRDDFNFHITILRSWVTTFHLHPPMTSLSRILYDIPRIAPGMDVFSEGDATF